MANIEVDITIRMPEGPVTVHGYLERLETNAASMTFVMQGRLRPEQTYSLKKQGWTFAQSMADREDAQTFQRRLGSGRTLRQRRRERQRIKRQA